MTLGRKKQQGGTALTDLSFLELGESHAALFMNINFNFLSPLGSQTERRHQVMKTNPQINRDVVAGVKTLWSPDLK